MEESGATLTGTGRFNRLPGFGFPTHEFVGDDGLIAQLGRDGPLRIFFGRGRRIRFPDGTEWRIKAATLGRHIVPVIESATGTVAVSSPLFAKRSYGINGPGYGLALVPLGKLGIRTPGLWVLRRREKEVAAIDYHERIIHAPEPIAVAAAIMAFTLITHGIPGEADLVPRRDPGH
jgi:hypothetical protein